MIRFIFNEPVLNQIIVAFGEFERLLTSLLTFWDGCNPEKIYGNRHGIRKGIIDGLHRGVTEMTGKGMDTGEDRAILMCALTVTEINNLRTITAKIDPTAFVATSNVCEVLGRGFQPLSSEK